MLKIKPVFKKNVIAICFAANNDYIPYTAVTIQSIIDQGKSKNRYDINILYTNISVENQKKVLSLKGSHKNVSIRFIEISELLNDFNVFTKSIYTGTKYTQEAYYRLLIPSIMPDYDKVLYLDGDMLALTDVAELYNTDIGEYMLASSRDYCGIGSCYMPHTDRREYREKILGLKNIDNYFISGMLIFNIKKFNERYTYTDLLEIAMSRDWRQHDQDVLNVICENSTLILSGDWDVVKGYGNSIYYLPCHLYEEVQHSLTHTKITHYAGPRKPWRYSFAEDSDAFWICAFKTPFFEHLFSLTNDAAYKCSITNLLYGEYPSILYKNNDILFYQDIYFLGKLSDSPINIEILEYKKGVLTIEGIAKYFGISRDTHIELFLSLDGKLIRTTHVNRKADSERFGRLFMKGYAFKVSFRVDDSVEKHRFKFVSRIHDHYIINNNLVYSNLAHINKRYKNQYYINEGHLIRADRSFGGNIIEIRKCGSRGHLKQEIALIKEMMKDLKAKNYKPFAKKVFCYRLWFNFYKVMDKIFHFSKIWLISDRFLSANDNGEALFSYLKHHRIKDIKPVFVIKKESPDYRRMKKIGKTVSAGGITHKMLFLIADKIVSAHADDIFINMLPSNEFGDLKKFDFVFLQHGIIKDDLSKTYSKYQQNMKIFVTSVEREYESIISNPNYGCDKTIVKLTGLPRFDKLNNNNPKRIITIIPTWRMYCLSYDGPGKWLLASDFEESEYYKNYLELLTNQDFITFTNNNGYKIQLVIHDMMRDTAPFFEKIPNVEILLDKKDYSRIFSETALLITDYSSVAFDYGYLKKPLIYWQFDKEHFFSSHTYTKGYFDYEKNGFGEVVEGDCTNVIDLIKDYIQNGCAIKEQYLERIDGFFKFTDSNNCQRVIEEIIKL